MTSRTWLLSALYGVLLASAVSGALKSRKFKIATTSTTEAPLELPENDTSNDAVEATTLLADVNATVGHTLTGIPQIDYIWDPNLPRELNGFNLSDYPFYSSIPPLDEIDFKCDGLHDGFYASVPHKCQVYHHCLYGTRYDFLCANFTAFDQKTFICHFASEVDCANSKKYWHRNDDLYKATTTAAPSTTSTTTTTARPTTTSQAPAVADERQAPRRRRPFRRRPAYDYYEDEYYDDVYERPRSRGGIYDRREDYDYEDRPYNRRDPMRNRDRDYREPLMRPRFPSRNNRREPSTTKKPDEVEDDRKDETRNQEDRRYDRGFAREDYEDPLAPVTPEAKPTTPISIYSRPRLPAKTRKPSLLVQQDRFPYKAAPIPAPSTERVPQRVTEPPVEHDYYEDDLEDTRPRRPMRRRPYRERERQFYDQIRDMRDRPAIRTRYRDEEDETRPRKFPERLPNRDRYHERSRDRALDRPKPDLIPDKPLPDLRASSRLQSREKEVPLEKVEPESTPDSEKHVSDAEPADLDPKYHLDKHDKPARHFEKPPATSGNDKLQSKAEEVKADDDYVIEEEYYDEPEYSSPAPPKQTVRIVKRPFLPSRGGNPHPRGLSAVGVKALEASKREHANSSTKFAAEQRPTTEDTRVYSYKADRRRTTEAPVASKAINSPSSAHKWSPEEDNSELKPAVPWNVEDYRRAHPYSSNEQRKEAIGPSGPAAKQRFNEVTHTLEDIPESEYDVTLNEALTPTNIQDSSLPSGFSLPHPRQASRDPLLQSSENNYRVSRPYNQQQKQKTFVPSPQFLPLTRSSDERSGSMQFFKAPEAAHGSGSTHRQPGRGPWHDYSSY